MKLILDGKEYDIEKLEIDRNGIIRVTTETDEITPPVPDPPEPAPPVPAPSPPLPNPPGVMIRNLTSSNTTVSLRSGQMIAFRFKAGGNKLRGAFGCAPRVGLTTSDKVLSISKFPGDFSTGCIKSAGNGIGEISWHIPPAKSHGCELTAGDYFLNIKNGSLRFPGIETCPDGRDCGFILHVY